MPVVVDDTEDLRHRLVAEVPGLLRYARSLERDPLRADDLVQDTLVRALERASTFRAESSLTTWLHRILHNLAVDDSRRRRDVVVDLSDDQAAHLDLLWRDDTYTIDAATVLARAELRERLQDALLRIPLIYRSAVVLHDAEGHTMTEVAVITDVTLPAAKQRLRRGRMLLVSLLADERDACSSGVPMRCWDARRRVSDYIDEDISERDRGLLELHLAGCRPARRSTPAWSVYERPWGAAEIRTRSCLTMSPPASARRCDRDGAPRP